MEIKQNSYDLESKNTIREKAKCYSLRDNNTKNKRKQFGENRGEQTYK